MLTDHITVDAAVFTIEADDRGVTIRLPDGVIIYQDATPVIADPSTNMQRGKERLKGLVGV